MQRRMANVRAGLSFGIGLLMMGCLAVAAGAGAGAAIAYTNRGASSVVNGTVDQVYGRAVTAFRQAGITQTGQSSEDNGAKRTLAGTKGDLDVTAELNRASATTTNVEIYARKNTVEYDKKFARDILQRIVKKS